jgi:hypothetical protein
MKVARRPRRQTFHVHSARILGAPHHAGGRRCLDQAGGAESSFSVQLIELAERGQRAGIAAAEEVVDRLAYLRVGIESRVPASLRRRKKASLWCDAACFRPISRGNLQRVDVMASPFDTSQTLPSVQPLALYLVLKTGGP